MWNLFLLSSCWEAGFGTSFINASSRSSISITFFFEGWSNNSSKIPPWLNSFSEGIKSISLSRWTQILHLIIPAFIISFHKPVEQKGISFIIEISLFKWNSLSFNLW